jgi:hypothetical protein
MCFFFSLVIGSAASFASVDVHRRHMLYEVTLYETSGNTVCAEERYID